MVPYNKTHNVLQFSKGIITSLKSSMDLNSDLPPPMCLGHPVSLQIVWKVCKKGNADNQHLFKLEFSCPGSDLDMKTALYGCRQQSLMTKLSFLVTSIHTQIVYYYKEFDFSGYLNHSEACY